MSGSPDPVCSPVLWRRVYRAFLPFGEPPWPARCHGAGLFSSRGPGWPAARLFCFLTLATPASSPLEYSERKISARRCLLWVFLRRSGLENSNSRGERNFVMFSFPIWKVADGSWFRDCGSDIFVLIEVQLFNSACFDILCTRRLHRALTDFHNGGKIPWHFQSEALFCVVFMERKGTLHTHALMANEVYDAAVTGGREQPAGGASTLSGRQAGRHGSSARDCAVQSTGPPPGD